MFPPKVIVQFTLPTRQLTLLELLAELCSQVFENSVGTKVKMTLKQVKE